MNILIDILHPAHVHFFRNAIKIWRRQGHRIAITTREKDVTLSLLKNYGLEYTCLSKAAKGTIPLAVELVTRDLRLHRFCRRFQPDVLFGISGYFISHVGKLLGKPAVVFDDTEHQVKGHQITWPFATEIHSPDCYLKAPVKKQRLYRGFHELAYLSPEYFSPDSSVLKELGIDPDEKYCMVRMVNWQAHHDVGQSGFDSDKMSAFLKELSKFARPYLSVEGDCPDVLKPYQLRIPVHQIHHVMAFAQLCVGEGATMISESAVLGVPAVYINTLKLGYLDMLEKRGLVKQTVDTDKALQHSLDFLKEERVRERCLKIRNEMLGEMIDVTQYLVDQLDRVVPTRL